MKKNSIYISLVVLLCFWVVPASAQVDIIDGRNYIDTETEKIPEYPIETISSFQKYKDVVIVPALNVPTVVEVQIGSETPRYRDYGILDQHTNTFEPYTYGSMATSDSIPVLGVSASATNDDVNKMIDNNRNTYTEFLLPETGQGKTSISYSVRDPIMASRIQIALDNNVSMPNTVEIRAGLDDGTENTLIVVAKKAMTSNVISFPATTASKWVISFEYSQPLRISDLIVFQENKKQYISNYVRFLAQPNHSYRVYYDPDKPISTYEGEVPNLNSSNDMLKLNNLVSYRNYNYKLADSDKDGIEDQRDNCKSLSNPDQMDVNYNGIGDLCDDFDKDGVWNNVDNCQNNPNRNQIDTDGDKIGDVCDKEESRITEKYKWIPWVGIGFAFAVIIALFALTARAVVQKKN